MKTYNTMIVSKGDEIDYVAVNGVRYVKEREILPWISSSWRRNGDILELCDADTNGTRHYFRVKEWKTTVHKAYDCPDCLPYTLCKRHIVDHGVVVTDFKSANIRRIGNSLEVIDSQFPCGKYEVVGWSSTVTHGQTITINQANKL